MPAKQVKRGTQSTRAPHKKAPAGGQPGRVRGNQSRVMIEPILCTDSHRSVARARKPRTKTSRSTDRAGAPLRVAIEVEWVEERDAAWCALWRWLLSESDLPFDVYLATRGSVGVSDGAA